MASANGNTSCSVSKVSGTSGMKNPGSVLGSSPLSPTVGTLIDASTVMRCEHDDRHERRRHDRRQSGKPEHDEQSQTGQRIHEPRHPEQLRHLREEHEDRERIHEANHHLARDVPHELRHPEYGKQHLQDPGQEHRGYQVVETVRGHERRDHEGDGTRGRGDHGRPAPQDRDRDRHR
ncbi:hypothetical protein GCM10023063_49470 [Arthrobacter methylotrophus]